MELPSWLKIEKLNLKLNFSGWFKYQNTKQNNITNNFNIQFVLPSINSNEAIKVITSDEIPLQEVIKSVDIELEFTATEKSIISKINQIHKLNKSSYEFEESYRLSLQHIKNKSSPDWYVTAASHMANAIQSGDTELGINIFFDSFENEEEPKKKESFIVIKDKIKYCYKRLQNMRHVDKSGELKNIMIPEYSRLIYGQDKITDEDYVQIFKDFQDLLLELFNNFKVKSI